MYIRVPTGVIISIMVATTGCDPIAPGDANAPAEVTARALEYNGLELNGWRLNGFRLNGFSLGGLGLTGESGGSISLVRIKLPDNSIALAGWLDDGELHALSPLALTLSGAQMVGAQLDFQSDDGQGNVTNVKVRIDAVTPLAPGSDVLRYDFAIKNEAGPWQPLCADSLGAQVGSVLLPDVWSPTTGDRLHPRPEDAVTVACLDAAIGKCVEWGYVPWKSVGEISLYDYHQACTRAVRADYCGDGVSHTQDGTEIHVLDQVGIETTEPGSTYVIEAEWGPDGAVCLNLANTRLPNPSIACELPACGASFASGGLIQTGKIID